jgi:hypothetical protein
MRVPALAPLIPLVLLVGLVSGCTPLDNQDASGATPEAADSSALLVALEDIAPGLGSDSSIDAAEQICAAIKDDEDSDKVDQLALTELGDEATGELTLEQAQNAVQLIATDYCV